MMGVAVEHCTMQSTLKHHDHEMQQSVCLPFHRRMIKMTRGAAGYCGTDLSEGRKLERPGKLKIFAEVVKIGKIFCLWIK
jgi:hypothetical protein